MKFFVGYFKRTFSNKYNLLLLLLISFHIAFFFVFQSLNKNYQTWDSAGHISTSYRIANEIKRLLLNTSGVSVVSVLKVSNYYPPFVQMIGAFISLIFGYKSAFLLLETLVFFIISILFTYKVTLLITKKPKLSILTTFIYSFFPQVIDQSHYFHLDLPLLALLLISIYFLYLSNNFKKLSYTLLFFVFFALIQVTKWYGFVFLIVPVLLCLFKAFFYKNSDKESDNVSTITPNDHVTESSTSSASNYSVGKFIILRNLVIGSVTLLLIVFPWYLANWNDLVKFMKVFSVGESDDPTNIFQKIMYYPSNMITFQIMFIPSLLLIASFVYKFIKNKKKALVYFLIVLVPWIVFIFISNKNLRYILPLTPFFAYLISSISIKISKKIKGFVFFVLIYLVLAFSFLSFNQLVKETPSLKYISMFFAGPNYGAWYYVDPTFYSYKPYRYPSDEILDFIYTDAKRVNNALGVAVLVDSGDMSAATLEMLRLENHYNNMYMPVPYYQFEPFKSDAEIEAFFVDTASDYVIVPDNPGPQGLRNYQALIQCIDYLKSDRDRLFKEIKAFPLPNRGQISVYKRVNYLENLDVTDGCRQDAGLIDGVETIKLRPNYTYTMFTGHFAIDDIISRDYQKGVIYVLQIENIDQEGILDIRNLPKSGSALCVERGLGIDTTEAVKGPLTLKDQCGPATPCTKSVLVKWTVGKPVANVMEYTKESFQ
jgi:4-amino-4-deoxy-L-arabinose transferase-like glycosyltransferase